MAKDEVSLTKPQRERLQHLSDLLHLFHHRNNNQHRRSIWYRHFSTFRKQLSRLVAESSELHAIPATHLERSRKRKRDVGLRTHIRQRIQVWQDVFVTKWHMAFSQLVADGRFAVLGVVLMAVLGEVCAVVGVTEGLDVRGEEEAGGVIERFGREMVGEVGDGGVGLGDGHGDGGGGGEDVGVAVVRTDGDGDGDAERVDGVSEVSVETRKDLDSSPRHEGVSAETESNGLEANLHPRTEDSSSTPAPSLPSGHGQLVHNIPNSSTVKRSAPQGRAQIAKKNKKRRKGDAIDQLFSGLG